MLEMKDWRDIKSIMVNYVNYYTTSKHNVNMNSYIHVDITCTKPEKCNVHHARKKISVIVGYIL